MYNHNHESGQTDKLCLYPLGGGILSCLLLLLTTVFLLFPNTNPAQASSTDSDLTVQVNSVLELSLETCNSTDSSLVQVDITPSTAGTFKSNCQTATVNTNAPGYTLTARSTGSNPNYQSGATTNSLLYLNPTTLTTLPSIPSTNTGTITTPTTLPNDTWGFAVNNRLNFPNTYDITNTNNESLPFAELPITDTTIYTTDTFPLPETDHTFFYAAKLTPSTVAGSYATTVTYTAIGEVPAPVPCVSDDIICIKVTEPGTIALQNRWTSPITYVINGSDPITIASESVSSNLNVAVGDVIEVAESEDNITFRSWSEAYEPLVFNTTYDGSAEVSITKMPSMNHFTTDSTGTIAGDYFFYHFNSGGALVSLPVGSFDTSSITTAGNYFFASFNYTGPLISLPVGSFDISNITATGDNFFYEFNIDGALVSLPVGSFDISNITSVGRAFFTSFNSGGALTSLPAGSFDTGNIKELPILDDSGFFAGFNRWGSLTSLPDGSFDTKNIISVGDSFFKHFNYSGALTSLPVGSFDTSNITSAGGQSFMWFNYSGALTSLPVGSFDTSNITSAGNDFCAYFNSSGALTSLPVGSFDTSNMTPAGISHFSYFNGSSSLNAGRLQAGSGASSDVIITNKSSSSVTFWQRPNGDPDGAAFSTRVAAGGAITFLAE